MGLINLNYFDKLCDFRMLCKHFLIMTNHNKLLLYLIISLFLNSCQSDDPEIMDEKFEGQFNVELIVNESQLDAVKSRLEFVNSFLISYSRDGASTSTERHYLDFSLENGSIEGESITLDTGTYSITEVLLLDEYGNVIFSTPLKASQLNNYSNTLLPVQFQITNNNLTSVKIEVISTESYSESEFGYSGIDFTLTDTFLFNISVLEYVELSKKFNPISGVLNIKADGNSIISKELEIGDNFILIEETTNRFELNVEKENYNNFSKVEDLYFLKAFIDQPYLVRFYNEVDLESDMIVN